ncbi:2315_t:CDS:2, partial [Racocetra persica]
MDTEEIYSKVYDFLVSAPLEHITATSVIFQGIEEDSEISQNVLKTIVNKAVTNVNNLATTNTSRRTKLLQINPQTDAEKTVNKLSPTFLIILIALPQESFLMHERFENAFEGVCSLRDIGAVETNVKRPLKSKQIAKNIDELKRKLKKNKSPLYQSLYSSLIRENLSQLKWENPLASQVISDDSKLVQALEDDELRDSFMEPKRKMVPRSLPTIVQRKCKEFVDSFIKDRVTSLPRKLTHNGEWKESGPELVNVTEKILDSLRDAWNNSAFSPEFEESQSEGTYVNNIILPAIRATLNCLPLRKSTYVSSSERKSNASADRKGNGRFGKRPDIMFVMKRGEKNYELIYTECSRLSCSEKKERDDGVKLWRETNDGMYWTRKGCKPDKGEFGIIGVQVAGKKMYLNVLIRDNSDVHRYYHLHESTIPIQQSDLPVVSKFMETLLIMRNILIVNMSLLYSVPLNSLMSTEDSST